MEFEINNKQINYLSVDFKKGLLEATRNGDRAALASEPRRNAARREEHERKIDLAAAPAVDAISLSENFRVSEGSTLSLLV